MEPRIPILCDLIYSGRKLGHGGHHRSLQLLELVREAGLEPVSGPEQVDQPNLTNYLIGLRAAWRCRIAPGSGWRWLRRWGMTCTRYRQARVTAPQARLLLWENSRPAGWIAPALARTDGLAVVAAPQNLEALGSGRAILRPSEVPAPQLCLEAEALRRADRVFTIAREEQWLLGLHGVAAGFLPYYPPAAMRERMLAVRGRREQTARTGRLLVMGTTTNPPTRQGILVLLGWWRAEPQLAGVPVDVVGTGTETFPRESAPASVVLHGHVPTERLHELLAGTRAVVAYQPQAVGALTRIPELLTAGVPVLANPIAARSTGHLEGVHLFQDQTELAQLIRAELPTPPVPAVPSEIGRFLTCLQGFAGAGVSQ